jgi:flagellar hook-basal body complex protein FliE
MRVGSGIGALCVRNSIDDGRRCAVSLRSKKNRSLRSAQKRAQITCGVSMEIAPINSQIAQAVERLKNASSATKAVDAGQAQGADFVASLDSALAAVSKNQNTSTELQRQFQLENSNVSLEETMIAMNKASLSFSAAVQVRNRLVQAYEQIMQMPV